MSVEQINELAKLAGITTHPDPSVTLRALDKVINRQPRVKSSEKSHRHSLKACDLGAASSNNNKVDDAIRCLRLIHVARLRDLQTQINEVLSVVQKITGNPKADLKIGRVGR